MEMPLTSMERPNTASLGAVPDDIKYLIIECLPDIHSLQSLTGASKPFKTLYELDRKRMLISFLARTMNRDVRSDALMALRSSMMMAVAASCDMRHPSNISSRAPNAGAPRLAEMDHFMENYIKDGPPLELKELLPRNIPLAAMDRLAALHGAVQFLTRDFCAWMEENQSLQKQEQRRIRFAQPLSASETARIHRAFYRIEVFGNLFRERIFQRRGDDSWYEDWDHLHILHRDQPYFSYRKATPHPFFKSFYAWEIEEMACIRDYMQARLRPRFEKIEPAFCYKRFPEICQHSGVNNHRYEEFRFDIPSCVTEYSDNRIERGLEHFVRILVADDLPKLTELLTTRLYTRQGLEQLTISEALYVNNAPDTDDYDGLYWDWVDDEDEGKIKHEEWKRRTQRKFEFTDDGDLSRPNWAYTKHLEKKFPPDPRGISANIYYPQGDETLRGVGYCFWDVARLEDWDA